MRIAKLLLQHKPALLVLVGLLVVICFCDLQIPKYVASIVDVGIQQGGVEAPVPERMTARTHDIISMMLDPEDEADFAESYQIGDESGSADVYVLTQAGKARLAALEEEISIPLILANSDPSALGFDVGQLLDGYRSGAVTKDQVLTASDAFKQYAAQMGEAMVTQQAIAASKTELQNAGADMNGMQMGYLLRIGLIMLALTALSAVGNILVSLLAARTGAKIGHGLREGLFNRVMSFSDAEIGSFSAASLITRGTNDIQLIQMVCIILQRMVLYCPILAIGGVIMISGLNLSMSWIIAVGVVAVLLLVITLMVIALPKFKVMQTLIDKVNLVSREMLTGIPVVRAFGRESHEEQRFDQASRQLMDTQLFTNRVMTFMMPCMMVIMNVLSVAIVWVGGQYIDQGLIQTGDMIAFITYSMLIVMSFLMLSIVAILLPRANVAAQRVFEVLETQPSITDPKDPQDAQLLNPGGVEVRFQDVSFSYAQGANNVLDHVSFDIPAGSTCAILGSTGSGKSTVLKLIERFYDVSEGAVLVDGIDVRNLSQSALHATFGYVPQQAFLFGGTVESNVGYGLDSREEAQAKAQMDAAIDIAQAREFVDSREEGMDAPIAQGGSNVSGGQRQRLAIARAMATNARGYLFDDSFSALDYKTDAALRAQLVERLSDRTVLIVAQRIATVMASDKIIVLENGRVMGQGTHQQLLATCKTYRDIALSQLSEEELYGQGAGLNDVTPADAAKGGEL